ncbi:MAG: histidine phosphatase family protein [Ruminococcaceae bacterium]|nr:histidine phosphatase family protein [Oscillospiraceae bacterium]
MKLYLIRHGESEANIQKCHCGWSQVCLTDRGIEQAKALRPLLQSIAFDRIESSDLIRAKQTAETALPGCEYTENPMAREINVGSLAGRLTTSLTEEEKSRRDAEGFASFGGENRDVFQARIRSFMKHLETCSEQCIAVFSHGGVLSAMLDEVLTFPVPRDTFLCRNCTVAVFECEGGHWYLHSWINPA